ESHVQSSAAYALGRIGKPAAGVMAKLRAALVSTDPTLRVVSAWSLVQLAPKDAQVGREALPVLMQGLQNPNANVRRGAAEALGTLGPAARAAKGQLQAASKDSDDSVREAAAAALKRIGG